MSREVLIPVKKLTDKLFKPFGKIIQKPIGLKPTISNEMIELYDLDKLVGATFDVKGPIGIGYFETPRRSLAPLLERHVKTPELLIPLEGCSILPIAPASPLDDPEAVPDPNRVLGFFMSGEEAVFIHPGVWHFIPNAVTRVASFVVVFRSATAETDLDVKDLKSELGVTFRFDLKDFI